MRLQRGDAVMLSSGGPAMFVAIVDRDEVWCVWFLGQLMRGASFNAASLINLGRAAPTTVHLPVLH